MMTRPCDALPPVRGTYTYDAPLKDLVWFRAGGPAEVTKYFRFGISPRGAQSLVLAAKGHALLAGRYNVSFDDLQAILAPTIRHRCQLNYEGEAEGIDAQALLVRLLDAETRKAA